MIARLTALLTICLLTTGAAMAPVLEVSPARVPWPLEKETAPDTVAPEGLGEAWGWVARAATDHALGPALTTADDGSGQTRPALVTVRVSFVVPDWLQAVWTALKSVLGSRKRLVLCGL